MEEAIGSRSDRYMFAGFDARGASVASPYGPGLGRAHRDLPWQGSSCRLIVEQTRADEPLRYWPSAGRESAPGFGRTTGRGCRSLGGLDPLTTDAATGERAGERLRRFRLSHSIELGEALITAASSLRGSRTVQASVHPVIRPALGAPALLPPNVT